MKILLTAINAKYIHSNLAVYSLRAYARENVKNENIQIEIAEYTINQQTDEILRDIYRRNPDVLCFSCYIWNITNVECLIRDMAKLYPGREIWVGRPEVSYDAEEVLLRLPQIKGVMKGEGEETFAGLCRIWPLKEETAQEALMKNTAGITFRTRSGEIVDNPWREPVDLSKVPFVYHDMADFANKIVYYETSRGCPFSCSYCLSSIDKKLRFRDMQLVKKELQFFIDQKVPQVKFVDRTFNCRHEHAMEIWRYITEHDNGITNFHFEVSADLLNEEEMSLMETMRPGLIQLEIGVQSTNPQTIEAIHRTMRFNEVKEHVERIKKGKNIHQHLDLIAGLPYEDLVSFRKSFDDVYALKGEQLQLGFLKVLKGSCMYENQKDYGLLCKDEPPYEVLCTRWLGYEDILELKGIEEMVEVYYNSGQFTHTMEMLEQEYASAYQMYRDLWIHYETCGYLGIQHRRSARYDIILEFVRKKMPEKEKNIQEALVYDYYLRENAKNRPEFAGEYMVDKEFLHAFYEQEAKIHHYLPGYEGYDKNQLLKMTHIEYFPVMEKMLLFDYKFRNPLNQEARTCMIEKDLVRGSAGSEL